MKLKKMGRTGLRVSEMCLGTMAFGHHCDEPTAFAILDRARERGINFLDTADVYPYPAGTAQPGTTESIIGRWFKAHPSYRHETILASKCHGKTGNAPNDQGLSRRHIMDAIDASLRRLGTEFIDLYQVHFFDAGTPLEETLRALDDIVRAGKVRYIGCCNHQAYQLARALWKSDILRIARYDCVQGRYNLLFREFEHELFPLCQEEGIGVIVYNPLAGGFLTGKYRRDAEPEGAGRFTLGEPAATLYRQRYWHDATFDAIERMKTHFASPTPSLAQVAIAWVLAQPVVTSAIVGATSAKQLDENLRAVDVTLDEGEMEFLNGLWFGLPRVRDPRVAVR